MSLVDVRVSVASMWQRFHGCDPAFIRDVCHGKCCDAPTRPTGTLITIHRSEQDAIRARGGEVQGGILQSGLDRLCPFKDGNHLCTLHETPDKPFGCIASPFTLNDHDCLIVRNRYRMLPCYEGQRPAPTPLAAPAKPWSPAFISFRASLDLIFGADMAQHIVNTLYQWKEPDATGYAGPKFWTFPMPKRSYDMLKDNDATKKKAP